MTMSLAKPLGLQFADLSKLSDEELIGDVRGGRHDALAVLFE